MSSSIKPGVAWGDEVQAIFNYAKLKHFALPAVNVSNTSTTNAVIETAAKLKAPLLFNFQMVAHSFMQEKDFQMKMKKLLF